jgi:putative endopeptidase
LQPVQITMRMLTRKLTFWLTTLVVLALAATLAVGTRVSAQNASAASPSAHGFDRADLDTTCKACDNFFQYANGGWIARNPIQPAYPSWGHFNALQEHNQEILRKILEAAAASKSATGSIEQKIGDFYASCMDEKRIESAGAKPLQPEFERIAKISSLPQLGNEVSLLHSEGIGVLFYFGSGQDAKDSSQVIGQAGQGGLGLPDRDYYANDDDKSKQIRAQYVQHVAKMFQLAGDAPATAAAEANTVMAIETQIAKESKTRVERRDAESNYHKMTPAELQSMTPDFSWQSYLQEIGFPDVREVNVGQPEFFQALDKQLTSVPLADWKTYLRWHVVHASATALSSKFVNEDFDFYGRTLTGAKELQPRWRRCSGSTDRDLGEALGQKYVAQAFPPEAKEQARQMVQNLVAALRADIATLPWMSPETRQQALAKLSAMNLKIGYPDKWRDYSSYQVVRGPYYENLRRGSAFEFHRELAEIGKPVDRTEWEMTPPTVNAYYDAQMNEIVFPAGILQPPFFDPQADPALNYGGMGAVIGHEMTHGFDDQGSKYDAQGNLRNWWTPEDLKNFQARAACVEKQFDGYVVADDLHENGKLVLGESIADLGGLTLAHMAFERDLAAKPAPQTVNGFTQEQLFFLGFARIWGTSARPEYERMTVTVDPHPLPRFRVDGPLSNMPEFQAAFSCQANEAMVRPADARCKIW